MIQDEVMFYKEVASISMEKLSLAFIRGDTVDSVPGFVKLHKL